MAEEATKKYAVVTGANKGIGYGVCKVLASNGITVILTARNEKRGLEAIEKLKENGVSSDLLLFHQLDVTDSASIASLAHFIKTHFGKLDILVNNAGVIGAKTEDDALIASVYGKTGTMVNWGGMGQTYEIAEECVKINYYGAKGMAQALVPLLQLSPSPRIVNVSSSMGKFRFLSNEWAKEVLGDAENLTEEKIDQVLNEYLKDFKENSLQSKGWPSMLSAYIVSKAAINGYTRVLAKKYPSFCINCLCPGFVKTDLNYQTGASSTEEAGDNVARLALLPNGGPSGLFFSQKVEADF